MIIKKKPPGERRTTADILKRAAVEHYAHKTYSCYVELGVLPWGKRRLDVFALNTKGHYVGIETKSCVADYNTDSKWREYLEHVNSFYFCVTEAVYAKLEERLRVDCKETGAGVMILTSNGFIKVVINAKKHKMCKENKLRLLLKVAWRGGESKRTIKRRTRFLLNNEEN